MQTLPSVRSSLFNLRPRRQQAYLRAVLNGHVRRVASIMLLVGIGWAYVPSLAASFAYLTDTEAGSGRMTSGVLDLLVTNPDTLAFGCTLDRRMRDATIGLQRGDGSASLRISASVVEVSGTPALCNAVTLDVQYHTASDTTLVYQGTPEGFVADLKEGELRFIGAFDPTKGPFASGTACTISIGFDAWAEGADGVGFHDYDVAPLSFVVTDASCEEGECGLPCTGCGDTTIVVENVNRATVMNEVHATSTTGGNRAEGGTVVSGTSTTSVTIVNIVNTNDTTITCDCSSCACGERVATTSPFLPATSGMPHMDDAPWFGWRR